jgi:uncharacterized repeat protein (TIGR02543 family)
LNRFPRFDYLSGWDLAALRSFTLIAVAIVVVLSIGTYASPLVYAGPFDFNVTVYIAGVPSFYSVRVFADGAFKGTVPGGGSLTIFFNDPGAGVAHSVVVDQFSPDGYPYYPAYPYPSGYWGIAYHSPDNRWTFVGPVTNGTSNTFYYYPLFLLQVQSDHGRPRGGGWYPAGSWAPISVDAVADESGGTRYRFDRWEGGNFQSGPGQPTNRVYMDAPRAITARWITQYYVTVNSERGTAVGSGWYDANSAVSFSTTSPVAGTEGVRYVFAGWSGDYSGTEPAGTITVTRPMTITANWKTQYWVSVEPNGGEVNQPSQWVDEGSRFTITAASPSAVADKRSRLVFTGWSGSVTESSQTLTVTVTSPIMLEANWKTQYFLAVVTPYSEGVGEGWYDAGATASFSLKETRIPAGSLGWVGVSNVFTQWSGDSKSTLPSGSLLMDSPKVVTAVWTTDYATLYIASLLGIFVGLAVIWKRSAIGEYVGPALGRPSKKQVPSGGDGMTPSKKAVPGATPALVEPLKKIGACPNCGALTLEGADFCIDCGLHL